MATTIEHPDALSRGLQSVRDAQEVGELLGETLTLNMGPSHPSTHGVLRIVLDLDGEVITRGMPDVGYLHRGDEKIAENMQYNQFVPYTDRLDYLAPIANNVAYALAVEKLMGWELPPRGKAIRVICCELARISSHLLGVGCMAMDIGAITVFLYTFTEREKIYNLVELLSGARFTTSYTRVGGQTHDLPETFLPQLKEFIRTFKPALEETDGLLTRNRIFVDRCKDVGVISKEDAIAYALSGPNLRGSGIDHDLRRKNPYLDYEKYDFEVPVGTVGDSYDRYLVRMEEMRQSIRILEQVIDKLPTGPINVIDPKQMLPVKTDVLTKMEELIHHFIRVTEGVDAPAGEVYFGAENPKGELGFFIHSKGGGVPYRLKIRSPSFVNLSILPKILPGHLVSDVVTILGSFDFVMGECDR
ncbi:NADH-quinone oxidoreductase subunit D [Terrimicrobium sacchariphilum]|jgi:NADH-quinone oxidoreductase subunit D|uniref:NADH-quinone oxidoreductase subunit D n=1 Tax=Terrimicrobium sacchariphilum TaxID=690879 RepID=A0A146GBW7_TERSA|nr:NADH dehydrogenase (quinone) subunit D [Terrimicrobium sacchariphilum]GAT35109.1 NADH-quinone oxidoreductase subunit D [Terrimicrobium sacchariphilum]